MAHHFHDENGKYGIASSLWDRVRDFLRPACLIWASVKGLTKARLARSTACVDTRTPEQRSRIMASVKTANTGPEWTVRRILHESGYRYRLHVKTLPGKPDIAFPSRRKAIFVHGCYWHAHGCSKGRAPKSRLDYWGPKLEANRARDARNVVELQALGWETLTVWQCETKDPGTLLERLKDFLTDR